MEQRSTNTWRMIVNEKKFIETALLSDLRVDGRCPFDYRRLTIKFGGEEGSYETKIHDRGRQTPQLARAVSSTVRSNGLFSSSSPIASQAHYVSIREARGTDPTVGNRGFQKATQALDKFPLASISSGVTGRKLDTYALRNSAPFLPAAPLETEA
ncbi:hypothetical protein F0562_001725 [Nyssa sinensis]|uniref:Uncharacterized protein n=1 Tax=Nyssa sinensis TaxID=561372 RepID=A0A5J5C8Z0_9ASTE|nr:hypothetical protein F0562_001725 [Nyssa sinensis]